MEIHCATAKNRLHTTSAGLRKAKVKEYQHFVSQTLYAKIMRDSISAEQTVAMTGAEAGMVRDTMLSAGMEAPEKPAANVLQMCAKGAQDNIKPLADKVLSPEETKQKVSKEAFSKSTSMAKMASDKMNRELQKVKTIVENIKKKPWGPKVVEHLDPMIAKQQSNTDELFKQ